MKRGCIFCGERRTIRGHVINKTWIASLAPPGAKHLGHSRKSASEVPVDERETDSSWTNKEFDIAVSCTCAECDGGWIDRLDHEILPLLSEMNSGNAMMISVTHQTAIAGWVAKTAAMVNCLERGSPLSFSSTDLARMRDEQLPPQRSSVWIAGATTDPDDADGTLQYARLTSSMEITGGDFGPVGTGKILSSGVDNDHVYLVTFRVHHLVFQIFVPNTSPELFPNRTAGFGPLISEIWPINLGPVSWPPRAALDGRRGFKAFADSFGATSDTRVGYFKP